MITDAKSLPRRSRFSQDPIGKTCWLEAHPRLINEPRSSQVINAVVLQKNPNPTLPVCRFPAFRRGGKAGSSPGEGCSVVPKARLPRPRDPPPSVPGPTNKFPFASRDSGVAAAAPRPTSDALPGCSSTAARPGGDRNSNSGVMSGFISRSSE